MYRKTIATVTKEQFEAYEAVRKSGITNMFDTSKVKELSGLEKEQILHIMLNYNYLRRKYLACGFEKEERVKGGEK